MDEKRYLRKLRISIWASKFSRAKKYVAAWAAPMQNSWWMWSSPQLVRKNWIGNWRSDSARVRMLMNFPIDFVSLHSSRASTTMTIRWICSSRAMTDVIISVSNWFLIDWEGMDGLIWSTLWIIGFVAGMESVSWNASVVMKRVNSLRLPASRIKKKLPASVPSITHHSAMVCAIANLSNPARPLSQHIGWSLPSLIHSVISAMMASQVPWRHLFLDSKPLYAVSGTHNAERSPPNYCW